MDLPENFKEIVHESKHIRNLQSSNEKVLSVLMISGDTEEVDENLVDWQLVTIDPEKLEIDLEFREPIQVSQGENPDRILIQVEMEGYKDENGNSLPPGLLKQKEIPV